MKIAYLLFAYRNPQVVKRVIGKLSSEDCAFFIHIDKKSDIRPFSGIEGKNVFFSEVRIPVYWAEYSGNEAILLLLRQGLQASQSYDYFVLLSGSDYPLRSGKYIQAFLAENRGSEFISIVKVPAPGKPLSRINTWRCQSDKPVRRFIGKALAKVDLAQRDYRKYLGDLEAYAGNTWWTLTRDAAQYILQFVAENQHVVEFFKDVYAPEESFFHTILGNSVFRSRVRRNFLYEDASAQGAHPAMINERHVALFEAQDKVLATDIYGSLEALFARKFSDESLDVMQRIDEMIERKEQRLTSCMSESR